MDLLLGLIFWGGLLVLTLIWLARTGLGGSHHTTTPRQPGAHGSPPAATTPHRSFDAAHPPPQQHRPARAVEEQRFREDEALADGLVIGHFLTRDHYQRRVDDLEDHLDEVDRQRDRWAEAAATGDDLHDDLDDAEFDAMGGFGVEPWADDLFDLDDED